MQQEFVGLLFTTLFTRTRFVSAKSHAKSIFQDKADDSLIGVKSTALHFGDQTKLWLSGFASGMVGSLYILGELTAQPTPYYFGLCGVAAHLAWQIALVDINNGKDCWEKFKANSWIGPIFLSGIILANLVRRKDDKKEQMIE